MYFALNTGYSDEPAAGIVSRQVTLQYRWRNGAFFYPAFDIPATTGPGSVLPNSLVVGTTSVNGNLHFPGIHRVKIGETPYVQLDEVTRRVLSRAGGRHVGFGRISAAVRTVGDVERVLPLVEHAGVR